MVFLQDLSPRWERVSVPSASGSAVRLAVAVLVLAAGISAGASQHVELCAYLVLALALAIAWGAPFRALMAYLRRAGLFLGVFLALLLIFNWRAPFLILGVADLEVPVSRPALAFGMAAVERGLLAVLVGGGLFLGSGPTALVAALEKYRVPGSAVTLLFLMFRYAGVLGDEARRVDTARRSRQVGRWMGPRTLARMSQGFLLRTYERSERVYLAMCSRGFEGRIPVVADSPLERSTYAVGGVTVALVVFVKLWFVLRSG